MYIPCSIDQALKNGRGQCPVCKSQVVNSSSFTPHYFRIYPSASESHDNQECINLKAKLAEANLRIATLSLEVSDTKNALNSSHQEQKTLSSKLKEANATAERTTKVTERLKEDIERIKRAKDDCHKRADKLKYLNQTLTSNLKESENLCQSLREQLVIQDVSSDSQGALNSVPSISGSLPLTQASQKDYLDLKKSYQELVIRERLATKKLADLAIQGKDSEDIENLANTQRVYKQLNEALTKLLKTTNNANQLKHEKKDILNEKKALQEKYNAANVDLKRLQLAEKIWTQNTSHLQDIIKRMSEDLFKLETLNQDCATDNNKLKERIKSLTESLAVSKKRLWNIEKKG